MGTRFRGGTRQGYVLRIATTKEEDQKPKVIKPPKVIFRDQHGHVVSSKSGETMFEYLSRVYRIDENDIFSIR